MVPRAQMRLVRDVARAGFAVAGCLFLIYPLISPGAGGTLSPLAELVPLVGFGWMIVAVVLSFVCR